MRGLRGRRRQLVVVAGAVLAILAIGGAALASVNLGTTGELTYRSETFTYGPGASIGVNATCPTARHVTGGGFSAVGGTSVDQIVRTSEPFDGSDADSVPDDGWHVVVYNNSSTINAQVSVYAICDN